MKKKTVIEQRIGPILETSSFTKKSLFRTFGARLCMKLLKIKKRAVWWSTVETLKISRNSFYLKFYITIKLNILSQQITMFHIRYVVSQVKELY